MALKATNSDQRRLLTLQDVDTRIVRLQAKAKALPQTKRIDELDALLATLDRAVLERLGAHDDASAEVARIESDVQTVEARLARDRERLLVVKDAKTATATEHEIETLERRRSTLEDLELEAMQVQEDAAAALAAARAEVAQAREERDRLAAERAEVAAGLERELAEARAERADRVKAVPADLLALYDRQRERYGIGATLLQHRTSAASGVELNASEMHQIRQAAPDDVILDPNSSAILVRTEESGL
ncbi:zinc ribbon domain-containing protein [Agrococcus sp. DT81.2]|uniref:zinc ribbon domain-containing protein n=1 Tax=Agrococcus sp. DT81.2 TaxID=3393414 RepID=UPI003CE5BFA5